MWMITPAPRSSIFGNSARGSRNGRAARGGADIRSHEQVRRQIAGPRARGGEDLRASLAQPCHHRLADPLGAAGDQRPAPVELETAVHERAPFTWGVATDSM